MSFSMYLHYPLKEEIIFCKKSIFVKIKMKGEILKFGFSKGDLIKSPY